MILIFFKMLKKINEFYDSGDLVGELFEKDDFNVLLLSKGVALMNRLGIMSSNPKMKNYIFLESKDFAHMTRAIEEWKNIKDTLWGRIPHGSSICGYLGATYYPPNSETGTYIKKGESSKHLKVGKMKKNLQIGSLDFVVERFHLIAKRKNQIVYFDLRWQQPVIAEAFDSYNARKNNYRDCDSSSIEDMIESSYH